MSNSERPSRDIQFEAILRASGTSPEIAHAIVEDTTVATQGDSVKFKYPVMKDGEFLVERDKAANDAQLFIVKNGHGGASAEVSSEAIVSTDKETLERAYQMAVAIEKSHQPSPSVPDQSAPHALPRHTPKTNEPGIDI